MKILLYLGTTYDIPCKQPVGNPPVAFGFAISDKEIAVLFMKPITDDYDYLILYKTRGGPLKSFAFYTTYGPIWADAIVNLQAATFYTIKVALMCAYNSSLRSTGVRASKDTRISCKLFIIFQCFALYLVRRHQVN